MEKRNQPTNPNGISCDGKIDLNSEKDWHYAARKFAEEMGIIKEGTISPAINTIFALFVKAPNSLMTLTQFINY
ncbi:hypothetical protein QYZ44_13335 [Vibrio parahaemolyticus]|nr:hypothetical protein [Vibrio parahaemolyticus]